MFTWLKKRRISRGMDEPSVVLIGWVPDEWLADFVIARTNHRGTTQRLCRVKTTKGDMWEISDAK